MSDFIENFNKYLKAYGIRQKFLSVRSGMSEDKVSKLLNEKKKITEPEMKSLANALGKDIDYFFGDFSEMDYGIEDGRLAFYAGEPGKEQAEVAYKLVEFIENMDEIFNSLSWYLAAGRGVDEF